MVALCVTRPRATARHIRNASESLSCTSASRWALAVPHDVHTAYSDARPTVHVHSQLVASLRFAYEAVLGDDGEPVSDTWKASVVGRLLYIMTTLRHLVALEAADVDSVPEERAELRTTLLLVVLLLVEIGRGENTHPTDEKPLEDGGHETALPIDSFPWQRRLRRHDDGTESPPTTEAPLVRQLSQLGAWLCRRCSEPLLSDLTNGAWRYAELATEGLRHATVVAIPVPQLNLATIDVDTAIESIVLASDAELGMQVFKEMVLSFSLPRGVIKVRHTLLLARETVTETTRDYPKFVEHAHTAALQGPSRVWNHGVALGETPSLADHDTEVAVSVQSRASHFLHNAEEIRLREEQRRQAHVLTHDAVGASYVERTCVLLAGLAMVFAPTSLEARKGVAFRGRVLLPFLSVPTLSGCGGTIELLNTGEWVYLRRRATQSDAGVVHREGGVRGLSRCAALMLIDSSCE